MCMPTSDRPMPAFEPMLSEQINTLYKEVRLPHANEIHRAHRVSVRAARVVANA